METISLRIKLASHNNNQHNNAMSEWKSNNARETAIARIVHLETENAELSKTIDGLRHDNRELKRLLDKAFDAGFELEDDE